MELIEFHYRARNGAVLYCRASNDSKSGLHVDVFETNRIDPYSGDLTPEWEHIEMSALMVARLMRSNSPVKRVRVIA